MYNISINDDSSYLIIGEKSAVIECVSSENAQKHLENIKAELREKELDYIILNHTAPDNTGSLELLLKAYPDVKIVASTAGIKNLTEQLNCEFDYMVAKDLAVLDLGNDEALEFYILPNLPWTDSMTVYYKKQKLLFCGSVFSHDENYFKNVIKPFKEYAKTASQRLSELDIEKLLLSVGAEMTNVKTKLCQYGAEEKAEDFVAVFYSSHYGFTAQMAQTVCSVFKSNGIEVRCFDADKTDRDELINAVNQCSCFAVGTNTVNRNASRTVWDILTGIDMINNNYKPCMIFGSCGWSGEGVYLVERYLKSIRLRVCDKPFLIKFKMSDDEKASLVKYTEKFISERE